MRPGISITLSAADRRRLKGLVRDGNSAQKHVWRADIVLLSADGVGTNEIMRRTGKSKTCVWRWQERFAEEGVEGHKTRPSRIAPLEPEVVERLEDEDELVLRAVEGPRHARGNLRLGKPSIRLSEINQEQLALLDPVERKGTTSP